MKRKRNSGAAARVTRQRGNEAKGKVKEAKSDELCSYFDILSSHLIAHILLQLPIKYLLVCKCVCKNWKTMISESHFAKLHFEQAPTSLMIRTYDLNRVGRTMHFLECESEKFEIGSNNHVKLEPIFKLPLRDAKSFGEKRDVINNKSKRPLRAVRLVTEKNNENNNKRKQSLNIACNPNDDKFKVLNSCNGFLCLCNPFNNIPLVICNPVNGEFIRLPEATITPLDTARLTMEGHAGAALGFHSKTKEYKVIKMYRGYVRNVFQPLILEIHTLGTSLWRNVKVDFQIPIWKLECPTCVNDSLHWIRRDHGKRSILCFSFESERLLSFPAPPDAFQNYNNGFHGNNSMGELTGLLYICDASLHDFTLWVMNEYGIAESWTKVYNIDTCVVGLNPIWRYGLCWPIKHFKKGAAILLFHSWKFFIYYEPPKNEFKVFQIQGTSSNFIEVISHIPSLISLKDVVKGDNIEVLNINSRCGKFKLQEENEVFSLSCLRLGKYIHSASS